jgi:hypothetical protein
MEGMTRRFLLALPALFCSTLAHAQLKQVQSVYLLPMGNGLDQYLATILVEQKVFQVVTDPKRADAIFVDRIGEGLEAKLAEMYPEEKKKIEDEKKDKDGKKNEFAGGSGVQDRVGSTNLQRGKGTIFLVDRRTHTVLWSLYSPSKSVSPGDTHRNAVSISKKLALAVKEVKQ